jgi:hypothetical protein
VRAIQIESIWSEELMARRARARCRDWAGSSSSVSREEAKQEGSRILA